MDKFGEKEKLTQITNEGIDVNDEGRLVVPKTDMQRLFYASLCSYLGALSFGFVVGYSSPALPSMTAHGVLLKSQESWFGSAMTVGGLIGCPAAGWLVARRGRQGALLAAALPAIVGWVLIAMGGDFLQLWVGRCLTGIGSGIVTVAAPMYIAETCPQRLRGAFGAGVQLAITVGILLVYIAGVFIEWSHLAMLAAVVPAAAAIMTMRSPETPRYLLVNNRRAEALRSLALLRGPGHDVEAECSEIEETIAADAKKDSAVSWGELIATPSLRRPLAVGVALMMLQQLSGINIVMFYTVDIFQSAGWNEGAAAATVAVGGVQVCVTIASCILMDRAGRRPLLISASIGMAVSCFALSSYYASANSTLTWLPLASLVMYVAAFSLGWGPIPMLVVSEIFPTRARATAASIATLANWLTAFVITSQYSALVELIGRHGVFGFFGGCLVFAILFVLRAMPETKGHSLEEIEHYFTGPRAAVRGV